MKTHTCPECGTENRIVDPKCGDCGRQLREEDEGDRRRRRNDRERGTGCIGATLIFLVPVLFPIPQILACIFLVSIFVRTRSST